MDKYIIPTLPLTFDVETKVVLKQAAVAHRRLAELKGAIKSMPNASCECQNSFLQKIRIGRDNYYINTELFELLQNPFSTQKE